MGIDGDTLNSLVTAINSQVTSSDARLKDALGNEISKIPINDQLDAYERINRINTRNARTSMMDKIKFASKS